MKVKTEGRWGCEGGKKKRNIDRARSFEQQNVPKASLPSLSFLTILCRAEERKHLKERCHSMPNYNTSNIYIFFLHISPFGSLLPDPLLLYLSACINP